jgi:hypothetical protein
MHIDPRFFATPSERLDAALQTVIAVKPGQHGSPLAVFAEVVRAMALAEIPLRERSALRWQFRCASDPPYAGNSAASSATW